MNFELTEGQKLLQEMVRDFAQKEILPQAKSLEESHTFPHELLKKLADHIKIWHSAAKRKIPPSSSQRKNIGSLFFD